MPINQQYYFPFGQPLRRVQQSDRSPKSVFVLGVYASAVHARWVDSEGKQKIAALAVASEPEVFWTGEDAGIIFSAIKLPKELGQLKLPTNAGLNGPSGRALDEKILKPLNFNRQTAWLCDLLPESRVNVKQREAINKYYTQDIISRYNLKPATVPDFDEQELDSAERRQQIVEELESSKAETLILLGNLPINWFLRFYTENKYSLLSQFGDTNETYGKEHELKINGKPYKVIPLCHPRQAGRLGVSNEKWGKLHDHWLLSR